MTRSEASPPPLPPYDAGTKDYLFDMIKEMAILARKTREPAVAIHLEAILAVRRELARAG